jgi:hypothetical protein
MDWTDLAQERKKRRALVKTVMNIREHKYGEFLELLMKC